MNVISILVAMPVYLIGLVKQKQLHKPNPNKLDDDVLKTLGRGIRSHIVHLYGRMGSGEARQTDCAANRGR